MTPSATTPLLELRSVTKRFGGTLALDDVSWAVSPGEVHCLVGENGSGKSTLIKLVAGVHAPDLGSQILFGGANVDRMSTHLSKTLGIQVIYQDLSIFPNLTVAENISIDQVLGNPVGVISKSAMRVKATEVLESLHHHLPLDAIVGTLPVAQRQIVAICRGLTANAKLLFMDEPTASLTRHEVDLLFAVVKRLKTMGVAVVFVSHRMDEIVEIAERVSVLRDGRLVGTFAANAVTDHDLAELMTGDRIYHGISARDMSLNAPALSVQGASRQGEFNDVSFELREGEVLGVTGLLGSGRTELALALFGMSPLDSGTLHLGKTPLYLRTNQDAIQAGIAYVSEDRLTLGLNLRQSISDNIALAVLDRIKGRFGFVNDSSRHQLASQWVQKLGIKLSDTSAAAHTLSGGNQQRIVLAKWLATHPKILILDSPTVGVDIRNKQGIYEIIRRLAADGVSILLISDEIPEVYFNADRVLHMRRGELAGEYVPGKDSIETISEAIFA